MRSTALESHDQRQERICGFGWKLGVSSGQGRRNQNLEQSRSFEVLKTAFESHVQGEFRGMLGSSRREVNAKHNEKSIGLARTRET